MATVFEYVDESGQDTAGLFFVVSMLIVGAEREKVTKILEQIERQTKKENRKWSGSDPRYRQAYIERIANLSVLKAKIFYEMFFDSKEYLAMTATAAADALRKYGASTKVIIFVDGLRESAVPKFRRQLKPSVNISVKVRGVRKDENNAFIRLVDAICGLVRDAYADQEWAVKTLQPLKQKGVLTKL